MVQVPGWTECESVTCHHATQNVWNVWLFSPRIFHLIFLGCGWPQVLKSVENKIGIRGLLHSAVPLVVSWWQAYSFIWHCLAAREAGKSSIYSAHRNEQIKELKAEESWHWQKPSSFQHTFLLSISCCATVKLRLRTATFFCLILSPGTPERVVQSIKEAQSIRQVNMLIFWFQNWSLTQSPLCHFPVWSLWVSGSRFWKFLVRLPLGSFQG